MAKLHASEAWLRKRFIVDKKTVDEIAAEAKVRKQTIYNNLRKFGFIK
jgi:predicted DNA-binding protein YlxM (UPF0122 family)